ncbi:stage III sporulation protein AA [Desulfofalx alkaliphila]|uniref:stage III sporulation protein AA n=1 Tax=Desulfofalx alkaliphila TaxID=105483 RepID=UPI00068B39B6
MILQLPPDIFTAIEEIRVRHGRPLILGLNHKDAFLHRQGGLADRPSQAYVVSDDDLRRTTQLISNSSIYALEEELKNGYITLAGGHRVGITGKVVTEKGGVKTMKYISGINIRVSRQVLGAADGVIKHLLSPKGMVYHTMLISPPRCGKTTLLRDIVRQLSNGIPSLGFGGINVGVVDERSEIAGCYQGVPQLDVGIRTDVLDACPKAAGMMMLLRSMSPGLIATDEIGRSEDVAAVEEVLNAGIKVLTTAHGSSIEELKRRPALSRLLSLGLIERYVILGRSRGVGTVEQVIDGISRRTLEGLRGVKRC